MASSGRQKLSFTGHPSQSSDRDIALILLIIALGLVVRLFAFQYTEIINPDGAIYINQARAIYYGLWDSVNNCSTARFPTLTTLSIAAFYSLFGDWVTAGTAVSLFFGTMTLVPLYLLANRFFTRDISAFITLIYALTHVLIDGSVDIVRDSTAWFFTTLGFYLFVGMKKQSPLNLIMSSVCFILAAWTRVEFFLIVAVSPIYILMDRQEKPLRRAAIFLLPIVVILLAAIGSQIFVHSWQINWYRLKEIPEMASGFLSHYHRLMAQLTELINHPAAGIPVEFYKNTKTLLWFLGFGVIFQNSLEAYYYPFFLIYLMGLGNIRQKIGKDRRVLYFVLLVPAAFLLLYCYVFIYWLMENRWISLALFPSFIFLGFGLERLLSFFQSKFRIKRGMALLLICVLILTFALPKNLKPRGEDKIIFKEIGGMIASLEGNSKKIAILTVGTSFRWISFYANLRFQGAPCPDEYEYIESAGWIGNDYSQFVKKMKTIGFQYFVWEEKNWPRRHFDFLASPYERDFIRLGSWRHSDTGKITLFRVR